MTISPSILQFRRVEIEDRIEELIALLDLLDGDENLEPALAWPLYGPHGLSLAASNDDDREHDDEREFDPAEDGIADADALLEQMPEFCPGPKVE
ncbi:hypothetical protein [Rhizobium gallicum]|uniref:hypothetical protein n=1 Tax=Rhizobium gallicum TaxID=56730 RepID=UPI00093974BF|nr:hypothetical protein [Rhizobium gallicum]